MPVDNTELVSATSLAMLRPLLVALDAEHRAEPRPMASLPAPVLWIEYGRVLLAATPITQPDLVRPAMIEAASRCTGDVIVVRHGLWPETLDDVEYDVVLGGGAPLGLLWSRCTFRHTDGSLWLVPIEGTGKLFIQLNERGLSVVERPPYADLDERGDGVARAARETVLAVRQLRRP